MRKSLTIIVTMVSLLFVDRAVAQTIESPVVLELFTSQGCSSCPPADKVLRKLSAEDPSLLPLSFHVHYWDYLGWKDPFSSTANTDRQKIYANNLSSGQAFTPQLIVNGEISTVGSIEREVSWAIGNAKKQSPALAISVKPEAGGKNLMIMIANKDNRATQGDVDLWAISFNRYSKTNVGAGENGGRTLESINNVTSIKHLGIWHPADAPLSLPASVKEGDGLAIIAQMPQQGRVLGAVLYE